MPLLICAVCQVPDNRCTKHGICVTCNVRINQGAKARAANGSTICAYTYCHKNSKLISQRGFCQECTNNANERLGRATCALCGYVEKISKLGICATCNHSFRLKTMELVSKKESGTVAREELKATAENHHKVEQAEEVKKETEAEVKAKKVCMDPTMILQVEEDPAERKMARTAESVASMDKEKAQLAKRVEMACSILEAQTKEKAAAKSSTAMDSDIQGSNDLTSIHSFKSISLEDAKTKFAEDEENEKEWNFVEISEIAKQGTNGAPLAPMKKKWWF